MSFPYKLDVEPGLKRSSLNTRSTTSSRHNSSKSGKTKSIIVPRESRINRSCIVDKEKVLNSTIKPKNYIDSKNAKEIESEETEARDMYMEIGVNTLISGPLKYHHHCLTHVRKRNSCDCNKRPNCRMRAKEIQAIIPKSYFLNDKACAQWIETSNCGTQFFEQFLSPLKPELGSYATTDNVTTISTSAAADIEQPASVEDNKLSSGSQVQVVLPTLIMDKETTMSTTYSDIVEDCLPPMRFIYLSPRRRFSTRWAISPYSVRGPDF